MAMLIGRAPAVSVCLVAAAFFGSACSRPAHEPGTAHPPTAPAQPPDEPAHSDKFEEIARRNGSSPPVQAPNRDVQLVAASSELRTDEPSVNPIECPARREVRFGAACEGNSRFQCHDRHGEVLACIHGRWGFESHGCRLPPGHAERYRYIFEGHRDASARSPSATRATSKHDQSSAPP